MNTIEFLKRLPADLTYAERAAALVWYVGCQDPTAGLKAEEVAEEVARAFNDQKRTTRVREYLTADSRIKLGPDRKFYVKPKYYQQFEDAYGALVIPVIPESQSVLPLDLFNNAKSYLQKLVRQLNFAYDNGLYDCVAVLGRRLTEALIIEVYEVNDRASEIKKNGEYLMLDGLIKHLESDPTVHLARGSRAGLKGVQRLGNCSAHARRYGTRKNDIDRERDNLRIMIEELLHLAKQAS